MYIQGNAVFFSFFLNLLSIFRSGKTTNYCRYAFGVFDRDNNGTLNFTEYVMAMHIHESDDIDDSLGLV